MSNSNRSDKFVYTPRNINPKKESIKIKGAGKDGVVEMQLDKMQAEKAYAILSRFLNKK